MKKLDRLCSIVTIAACAVICAVGAAYVVEVRRADAGEVAQAFDSGTFTPTVVGVGTAGTASYTVQVGRYSRVGTRVHATVALTYTGGTGTGQGAVAGLPFAARGITSADHVCSLLVSAYTYGAVQVSAGISQGESQVRIWGLTSGGAIGAVAYDAAASIWLSCTYEVAP